MIRLGRFTTISLLLGVLSIQIAFAQQPSEWERTLATTASLRTAGARLVTSDALRLEDGNSALITYWETAANDLAIYRCVDMVDSEFDFISQACWKVLAPTGTRSLVPLGRRPTDVG